MLNRTEYIMNSGCSVAVARRVRDSEARAHIPAA